MAIIAVDYTSVQGSMVIGMYNSCNVTMAMAMVDYTCVQSFVVKHSTIS